MGQLYKSLERAKSKVGKLGDSNYVFIDNVKDEMVTFTIVRKQDLKRNITEASVTVQRHTMGFNTKDTR